uniref:Uncharacterized protein n=1 Tax=Anguilla anguilla TaxID=7936 RepID=A0A0E9XZX0_ANGAN
MYSISQNYQNTLMSKCSFRPRGCCFFNGIKFQFSSFPFLEAACLTESEISIL